MLHTLETACSAVRGGESVRDHSTVDRPGASNGTEQERRRDEKGVGTGVVIVDKGVILTNLHVVFGAKRVQVVFADGLESDATVTGTAA